MSGYIDLHCHYLPAIDDGVRTLEDGMVLCRGLKAIGFDTVVATPHIRTAMFENRRPGLERAFEGFRDAAAAADGMPALGLGAEHFFDDVVWDLFMRGEAVPYPGGRAALVEFPSESIPARVADRFFELQIREIRPVLAHPERYPALFRSTDPLDRLLDVGALPLLDVMALVGRYGRRPRRAAERMLDEGVYYAACSDSHRPGDVDVVAEAIQRLHRLVGEEEARELLAVHPRAILDGTAQV
ncbi:MAG: tyrosine-protein phosphatase [Myxococcota bacterium]